MQKVLLYCSCLVLSFFFVGEIALMVLFLKIKFQVVYCDSGTENCLLRSNKKVRWNHGVWIRKGEEGIESMLLL